MTTRCKDGAGELARGEYRVSDRAGYPCCTWLELQAGDNASFGRGLGQIRRRAQERGIRLVPPPADAQVVAAAPAEPPAGEAPRQKRKYTRRKPAAEKATPAKRKYSRRKPSEGKARTAAPRAHKALAAYREQLQRELDEHEKRGDALEAKLRLLDEIEAAL